MSRRRHAPRARAIRRERCQRSARYGWERDMMMICLAAKMPKIRHVARALRRCRRQMRSHAIHVKMPTRHTMPDAAAAASRHYIARTLRRARWQPAVAAMSASATPRHAAPCAMATPARHGSGARCCHATVASWRRGRVRCDIIVICALFFAMR